MLRVAAKMPELDIDRLMEIYTESRREELHAYLREDFFSRRGSAYYIWEREGTYLAALRLEGYADGMLLSGLQTRPDRRRKGYARALMGAVFRSLPAGTKVYSHVVRNNRASLALHAALGFEKEKDFARLLDGTVTSRYVTLVSQVRAEIS